eukprot:10146386-Alexandrium_andersonii.AAC.1
MRTVSFLRCPGPPWHWQPRCPPAHSVLSGAPRIPAAPLPGYMNGSIVYSRRAHMAEPSQ